MIFERGELDDTVSDNTATCFLTPAMEIKIKIVWIKFKTQSLKGLCPWNDATFKIRTSEHLPFVHETMVRGDITHNAWMVSVQS